MKITIKLDTRGVPKQTPAPLRFSVSHKGDTAYISTDIRLTQAQWDAKLCRVINHPNKTALNYYIGERLMEYQQAAYEFIRGKRGQGLTAIQIRDGIRQMGAAATVLTTYAQLLSQRNGNTNASYSQTRDKIAAFAGGDLSFDDITPGWLADWDAWMKGNGLATNSRAIHHRNFRALFNFAIDRELTANYPYRRYTIQREQTEHRTLTLDQMRWLANTDFGRKQRYVDVFLTSFALMGMNLIDVFNATEDCFRDGRLYYRRSKTGELFSPMALRWTELPKVNYRNFNKKMNKALTALMGFRCTSYFARHTWATIASQLGVPKDTIDAALGHTKTVTDIYINYDRGKVDDAQRQVYDAVFG